MEDKIVIVGAGIAGVQAATTLSANGIKPILITNEPYPPYYRMRLEEVVTGGSPESIAIHPYSWYEEKGIELINGNATALDRIARTIKLDSGKELRYSKLIIATGATAFSFPIERAEGRCFVLRTMENALSLNDKLKKIKALTIIGGGLLGLEAAVSIKEHFDISVNVVESQEYILSKQLDKDSSLILKRELERRGITIFEASSAKEYKEGSLILSTGCSIPSDLILLSVGVRSAFSFLENSGIETNKGIIVDSHLNTNDSNIYALGDVAQFNRECFSLAMYAREQGIFVANEIVKGEADYIPSEPSSMLKVAGIDIAFLGSRIGEIKVFEKENSRISCFVDEGKLKGIILINAKSFLIKARNSIDKEFNESEFVL